MLAAPRARRPTSSRISSRARVRRRVDDRWRQLTARVHAAPRELTPAVPPTLQCRPRPDRWTTMIDRLLQPLLSLHGWPAYTLVGLLVFAEAAVMLGFVFPGETAAILGGVLASEGGVNLEAILAVVVVCAIALGDSVGYGRRALGPPTKCATGPLRKRQKGLNASSTSSTAAAPWLCFVARFSAFLRRGARPGRPVLHALPGPSWPPWRGRRPVLGRALRPARLLRRAEAWRSHRDARPTSSWASSSS